MPEVFRITLFNGSRDNDGSRVAKKFWWFVAQIKKKWQIFIKSSSNLIFNNKRKKTGNKKS